jgi:outer membrane biosynthesis protein TonB
MKNQKTSEVRIVVKFTIGKHGYIVPSSIEFLQGSVKAFNDEVRRVLLSSPRWEPGKQKGEPVAVSYTLPVVFIWH